MAPRSTAQELRLIFFPLMAPGHVLPVTNAALLFADCGVRCTILTTPSGAALASRSLDRAGGMDLPIDLHLIHFPAADVGLPDGVDDLTLVTSLEMHAKFYSALDLLRGQFERLLREIRADAVITDIFLPWTAEVARTVGVPRIVFHSMGFFPLCVLDCLERHAQDVQAAVATGDRLVLPGLPHRIEMRWPQLHDSVLSRNAFSEFMDRIWESERESFGTLVNSFYELEPEYADYYRNTVKGNAWHIGPVSLRNWVNKRMEIAEMGNSQENWSAWLDSREPGSVIYVCFGSLCRMTATQLREIAMGLEKSSHPFIWVVDGTADEAVSWLPQGFKERVAGECGRGLLMWGWAPQVPILSHRAVGGFVTHCGWNSLMEAISAGQPLVTWPLCAEQFYNERLAVDVLGIGVPAGAVDWGMKEEEKTVVSGDKLAMAVGRVMSDGEEANRLRKRASEMKEKAHRATEKGGSSCDELERLIKNMAAIRAADADPAAPGGLSYREYVNSTVEEVGCGKAGEAPATGRGPETGSFGA